MSKSKMIVLGFEEYSASLRQQQPSHEKLLEIKCSQTSDRVPPVGCFEPFRTATRIRALDYVIESTGKFGGVDLRD